jgi:hypothetical protein
MDWMMGSAKYLDQFKPGLFLFNGLMGSGQPKTLMQIMKLELKQKAKFDIEHCFCYFI